MLEIDRFRGCLLGLAVGDAVGTTVEFKAPGSFPEVTDMTGGGPFGLAPGQWTDDTSMALCLADSLLDDGRLRSVGSARALRALVQGGLSLQHRRVLRHRRHDARSAGAARALGRAVVRLAGRLHRRQRLDHAPGARADALRGHAVAGHRARRGQLAHDARDARRDRCLPLPRRAHRRRTPRCVEGRPAFRALFPRARLLGRASALPGDRRGGGRLVRRAARSGAPDMRATASRPRSGRLPRPTRSGTAACEP